MLKRKLTTWLGALLLVAGAAAWAAPYSDTEHGDR